MSTVLKPQCKIVKERGDELTWNLSSGRGGGSGGGSGTVGGAPASKVQEPDDTAEARPMGRERSAAVGAAVRAAATNGTGGSSGGGGGSGGESSGNQAEAHAKRSMPDRWGEMTKKQRNYWKDRHWG